ncbi:MAG: hypothetical protein ACC612_12060 [Methanomethylovorans sp.]|uniref:hypothetical protein n=1 Tax=Methanomethylovorans sp. TaxID=2758717 RepID=UPI00353125A8
MLNPNPGVFSGCASSTTASSFWIGVVAVSAGTEATTYLSVVIANREKPDV